MLGLASAGAQPPEASLRDPDPKRRLAAVESIIDQGGSRSLDLLAISCQDGSGAIQQLAVAGIVNFYIPGYVKSGVRGKLAKIGDKIVRNSTEYAVEPWIRIREQDGQAILGVFRNPKSEEAKLEAVKALGSLRYQAALPELLPLLKSKQDALMLAALRAVELSENPAAVEETRFLLRDPNEAIHLKAMTMHGVHRNAGALPDLAEMFARKRSKRSEATALEAIALIASPESRGLLEQNLDNRDGALRGYAAEGLGRMKAKDLEERLAALFANEESMRARLGQAFALVQLGRRESGALAPFDYLFNTLNSLAWRGIARAYWMELAREDEVRARLREKLNEATKAEKVELAGILARTGGAEEVELLEKMMRDPDGDIAQEAIKATKLLKSRLP
ncbi:MAG: hypothetical protein OHK0021_14460 [Bryobacter sp.]